MDVRLGVVADTHGLFDPALGRHFLGVDRIIHAGDIGDVAVIEQLQRIAPIIAVSGNVDSGQAGRFPAETVIELAGYRIAVRHIVYEGGKIRRDAQLFLDRTQPDICIFGHSHKPRIEWIGRLLLFNPGSAGPRRFSLPRSLGLLLIQDDDRQAVHIPLPDRAERLCPADGQSASSDRTRPSSNCAVGHSARAGRIKAKGGKR
ncbi:MAG: metallophosphoesterase family protein [Nitrospira sp.]|nr:metallophosphoesterase family protein [Nitrospira sp.]